MSFSLHRLLNNQDFTEDELQYQRDIIRLQIVEGIDRLGDAAMHLKNQDTIGAS